jgi:hypothetical protein
MGFIKQYIGIFSKRGEGKKMNSDHTKKGLNALQFSKKIEVKMVCMCFLILVL